MDDVALIPADLRVAWGSGERSAQVSMMLRHRQATTCTGKPPVSRPGLISFEYRMEESVDPFEHFDLDFRCDSQRHGRADAQLRLHRQIRIIRNLRQRRRNRQLILRSSSDQGKSFLFLVGRRWHDLSTLSPAQPAQVVVRCCQWTTASCVPEPASAAK